jgi:hypothetical protein
MMYSKPGHKAFKPFYDPPYPWSPSLKDLTDRGKGPSIDTIPPDRTDVPLSPFGRYSGDSGGSEDEIYINENTWDYIQSESPEDHKKNAVLHMAITILHETAHWMNDVFISPNPGDVSGKERYPDTGDRLEQRLFKDLLGEYQIKLQLDGSLDRTLVDWDRRVHREPLENDIREKMLDRNHWNKRGSGDDPVLKDSPLNITISMASSFTATEPVIVTVNYRNDGNSTIWIPNRIVLENNPLCFNITHIASQTFMGFEGPQHRYNFGPEDYVSLDPKESLSVYCDLRYNENGEYSRYRLYIGGDYEINAVYEPVYGYTISESNRLIFTMQAPGNLTGNVTNSITGNPIPEATVSVIQNARILRKTRTDSNGHYNFTYLPPGSYMVKARIPGTQSVFQYNVEILPERTTWLDLYLFTGEGPQLAKISSWDDESEGLARRVTIEGDLAFVADLLHGMKIINISDPANPWLVGKFKDGDTTKTFDVAVSGDYAYIADERYGLKIVDISDPSKPVKVGEFKDGGNALGVEVLGSLVYVADQSDGLEIIDVSDPKNPVQKGQFFDGGSATDLCIVGTLAYIADGGAGLDIIDISDPSNPWKVGGRTAYNAVGIDVEGNYAYIASMEGGLRIIDISRPDKPQEKGWFKEHDSDRAHDVDVVFPYAYVALRDKGIDILDISDPTPAQKLNNFFDGGQADGISVIDNIVYVADKEDGLEILIA